MRYQTAPRPDASRQPTGLPARLYRHNHANAARFSRAARRGRARWGVPTIVELFAELHDATAALISDIDGLTDAS